jgi:hypothetical protein
MVKSHKTHSLFLTENTLLAIITTSKLRLIKIVLYKKDS